MATGSDTRVEPAAPHAPASPVAPLLLDGYIDAADAEVAAHLIVVDPRDLTYECRTLTTDDDSRRRFSQYWWLIRPFVQHIMDATLRTIGTHAEALMTSEATRVNPDGRPGSMDRWA